MPAKDKKKGMPAASRRKRFLHAFYLVQPFLQFFALIAVALLLARCSPLAPSSDRALGGLHLAPSDRALIVQAQADEDLVRKSLKEVSDTTEIPMVSESAFAALTHDCPHADVVVGANALHSLFRRRNRTLDYTRPRILAIPLSKEQRMQLLQEGNMRIDLADRLHASMGEETRKVFFLKLQESLKHLDLGAKIYLVFSDNAMHDPESTEELPVRLKVSLGIPATDRAYLELRRVPEATTETQSELVRTTLGQASGMAIVLE